MSCSRSFYFVFQPIYLELRYGKITANMLEEKLWQFLLARRHHLSRVRSLVLYSDDYPFQTILISKVMKFFTNVQELYLDLNQSNHYAGKLEQIFENFPGKIRKINIKAKNGDDDDPDDDQHDIDAK